MLHTHDHLQPLFVLESSFSGANHFRVVEKKKNIGKLASGVSSTHTLSARARAREPCYVAR